MIQLIRDLSWKKNRGNGVGCLMDMLKRKQAVGTSDSEAMEMRRQGEILAS